MSHTPENDLARHLKNQEQNIHGNLFMLNQLFQIYCDDSLDEKKRLKQAIPLVDKLAESNPIVAKEIKDVLATGDPKKIEAYFKEEQDALIQTLTTEIQQHQDINKRINKENIEDQPTDS
ncbi:MAG: hypothetical protein KDK64_05225 [Chlamydiia bacterium]|nr:hypothetical protein [Chlamydiia bacterium]